MKLKPKQPERNFLDEDVINLAIFATEAAEELSNYGNDYFRKRLYKIERQLRKNHK